MGIYTVCDLLNQHEGHDSGPILIDGELRLSHADLIQRVRAFAGTLQAAGVKKGDRVAIFLRRSIEAVIAVLGAHTVGGVVVLINDKLRPQQVDYIVDHSESVILITDDHLLRKTQGMAVNPDRILSLDHIDPADSIDPVRVVGRDLAMIIYTSGSTGMPKGVMLSHENLVSGASTVSDYLNLSSDDILISLLPFTFDYGLNQLTTSLRVGATLVLQRSMFPADICRTLQREKVTGIAGVPMLWTQLAQPYSPFLQVSLPHLRYITNSGGRFPPDLVPAFRQAHPQARLFLMYGLTEAFRSTYLPPDQVDHRPNSIGKAIPNVEILLMNDKGEPCAPNEPGELVHRGAHVALGYWRDPHATARVYRPHPFAMDRNGLVETVVFSGDLAVRDEEGYLYFIGRRDQMIKSSGFRVSPEEIEHYLQASGLIVAAAVFTLAGGNGEPRIIAAVIPRSGVPETALQHYCKKELPEYMNPAELWYVEAFPHTTSGKPDRNQLKDAYLVK
jgi:amino acid adenylation domain-containing protein